MNIGLENWIHRSACSLNGFIGEFCSSSLSRRRLRVHAAGCDGVLRLAQIASDHADRWRALPRLRDGSGRVAPGRAGSGCGPRRSRASDCGSRWLRGLRAGLRSRAACARRGSRTRAESAPPGLCSSSASSTAAASRGRAGSGAGVAIAGAGQLAGFIERLFAMGAPVLVDKALRERGAQPAEQRTAPGIGIERAAPFALADRSARRAPRRDRRRVRDPGSRCR